jgi:hypothetical protein
MTFTIESIKAANTAAGLHFFDADTMRFFRSRVSGEVFQGPGGVYFVTSEQFVFRGEADRRKFTVRAFEPATGRVHKASGFGEFTTLAQAKGAARKAAAQAS